MAGVAGAGGGSSGGDAGAIRAGKAFVEMGVKDNAEAQLQKMEARFALFGKNIAKAVEGVTGKANEVAGSGGVKGLAIFGAAAAMKELAGHAEAFVPALAKARREMEVIEQSARTTGFLLERIDKDFTRSRDLAETPGERMRLLNQQIAANNTLARSQRQQLDTARAMRNEMGDRSFVGNFLRDRFTDRRGEDAAAEAAIAEAGSQLAQIERATADLRRARDELLNPFKNREFVAAFQDLGQQIKDAFDPAIAGMGEMERKVYDLLRANAGAGDEAKGRMESLLAEAKKADEALKWRNAEQGLKDLKRAMFEATDPKTLGMGDFERRMSDFIRDNLGAWDATPEGRAALQKFEMEAKATDERVKKLGIDRAFGESMLNAQIKNLTVGLSPEDAALAALVQQGFSNDQIQQLRRVQQEMAAAQSTGFFSRGGLASADAALQFGVADQWKQVEEQIELTNERLEEIRELVESFQRKLGFK